MSAEQFQSEAELKKAAYDEKIISRLNPHDREIWFRMNKILGGYIDNLREDKISVEQLSDRQQEMRALTDGLTNKYKTVGKGPWDYMLWHKLVGSTLPEDITELDTPEHEIEKFIRSSHSDL